MENPLVSGRESSTIVFYPLEKKERNKKCSLCLSNETKEKMLSKRKSCRDTKMLIFYSSVKLREK